MPPQRPLTDRQPFSHLKHLIILYLEILVVKSRVLIPYVHDLCPGFLYYTDLVVESEQYKLRKLHSPRLVSTKSATCNFAIFQLYLVVYNPHGKI